MNWIPRPFYWAGISPNVLFSTSLLPLFSIEWSISEDALTLLDLRFVSVEPSIEIPSLHEPSLDPHNRIARAANQGMLQVGTQRHSLTVLFIWTGLVEAGFLSRWLSLKPCLA